MKKLLVTSLIMTLMTFNIALAEETAPTVDPGITPDSSFYVLDTAMEELQLAVTTDPQTESELLLDISQERLAEAEQLITEEKEEYLSEVMQDYVSTVEEAQETIGEVITNPETDEVVKEELATQLEETSNVDENITGELPEDQQTELTECINQSALVANVVKDLDPELVQSLVEQELGYGQIAKIVALSNVSGKTVDEIVTTIKEGTGIGVVAQDLGIKTSDLVKNSSAKSTEKGQQQGQQTQAKTKTQDRSREQVKDPTQKQEETSTNQQTQQQKKTQAQINKPETPTSNQESQKDNQKDNQTGNQSGSKGNQQKQQIHKE